MTNGKAFLVTSGEYSDYRVECAFASRELAEAFCERENGTGPMCEYEVEEIALLDALPPACLLYDMEVEVQANGAVLILGGRETRVPQDVGQPEPALRHDKVRLRASNFRSSDAAEKALRDMAARLRAEEAGIA